MQTPHSKPRFPAPVFKEEGCRKPALEFVQTRESSKSAKQEWLLAF